MNRSGSSAIACPMNVAIPAASQTASRSEARWATGKCCVLKSKRSGKIFLDWSQNAGSKTTLSPYSLRGLERPTVATPVTWDEVGEGAEDPLALEQFRYDEVLARVEEHGDLFTG